MYRILSKESLNPNVIKMVIEAPMVARKALPGQFIIFRVSKNGERIPLTIADYDREHGTVTIIFQEVGKSTKELSALNAGDSICDFVGPLGKPSDLSGLKRVLCIGGGVGTAVVYPQVKLLHKQGTVVDVIVGAKSKDYVILEKEITENCNELYITTDDGSYIRKGFVTDVMKELLDKGNKYDEIIAIGPLIMMKVICNITKDYGVKTVVSMNPIMVDGTGMCGGCRVSVGGRTMYACVDGPEFDGHLVDFDLAMKRQQMYKAEEKVANDMGGGTVCR